jgi:hypothetical protein
MKQFNTLFFTKKKLLTLIFLTFSFSICFAQSGNKNKNAGEINFKPQFFLDVNYLHKAVEQNTYLRKGYKVNAGIAKPFLVEGDEGFSRIYSIIFSVSFGQSNADGALQDIKNQKNPLSFAVLNSLNPFYTSSAKKAFFYNAGIGLRQELKFKNIALSFSGTAGYQRISRPEFLLEDNVLNRFNSSNKIIYARGSKVDASGLFFKPAFELSYWVSKKIGVYANVDYTFGARFKGNQIVWNGINIDGDPYFSTEEVQKGYFTNNTFDKPVNMLSAGVGVKFRIGK